MKNYVRSQFKSVYLKALNEKKRKEEEILAASIIEKITTATSLTDVISTWRDGLTTNDVSYKLKNSSSTGFKDLSNKLLDLKAEIPLRAEIIKILLLGRDDSEQIVYNHGGICYLDNAKKFKKAFLLTKSADEWQKIEEKIEARGDHSYRKEKRNRHGHGNMLKSYYGLGHKNLLEYFKTLKREDVEKYCLLHVECCDANNAMYLYWDWQYKQMQIERGEVSDEGGSGSELDSVESDQDENQVGKVVEVEP